MKDFEDTFLLRNSINLISYVNYAYWILIQTEVNVSNKEYSKEKLWKLISDIWTFLWVVPYFTVCVTIWGQKAKWLWPNIDTAIKICLKCIFPWDISLSNIGNFKLIGFIMFPDHSF